VILLDTHVWLQFILGDNNLAEHNRQQIELNASPVYLSAISVWEACVLAEKGRIELSPSAAVFLRKAIGTFPFQVIPVTHEIAILSRELPFDHQDPADRLIAATAQALNARLATQDKLLRKLAWLHFL